MSSVELPLSALTSTSAAASAFGLNRRSDRAAVRRAISGTQASAAASIGETVTAALSGFVLHLTSTTHNPLNMFAQKNPSEVLIFATRQPVARITLTRCGWSADREGIGPSAVASRSTRRGGGSPHLPLLQRAPPS